MSRNNSSLPGCSGAGTSPGAARTSACATLGSNQGQAMVEAAFSLMLFLALVFGVIEFGRAVWTYTLLSHAVREGTRYASVHGKNSKSPATVTDVANVVVRQAPGLRLQTSEVQVTWTPNNSAGSDVRVTATHNYRFLGPFLPRATQQMQRRSQVTILN